MKKIEDKAFDFSAKLRQQSVLGRLKDYIAWQRSVRSGNNDVSLPWLSPVSVNLDLTTACNFACPHCVDSGIINTGEYLDLENIKGSIDRLKSLGLLSVILIGGGEPTLHRDFEDIVRFIKGRDLQLGLVTNGVRLDRVFPVADLMSDQDWVRISIDAAREETFIRSHRPKQKKVGLRTILDNARELKRLNPDISLGYSFVIVWDGIEVMGQELCPNVEEISEAVKLAREYSFDFVSYKPCLLRLDNSQKETLFDKPDIERETRIIDVIRENLAKAEMEAGVAVKILQSVNLQAMLDRNVHELKKQPRYCHMQFFRTVLTPSGIFHCPAFRGVEKAKFAPSTGYMDDDQFDGVMKNLEYSIQAFDASRECDVVACFYHHVNWWVENFIVSGRDIDEIEEVGDTNFFL
ncbi:MAG: radical SAM protein [Deltaproteobacteria bacterium]|nr:radical SAM protein [Deltaproteobacteria bacterium]